jgi:hypothetical protein
VDYCQGSVGARGYVVLADVLTGYGLAVGGATHQLQLALSGRDTVFTFQSKQLVSYAV